MKKSSPDLGYLELRFKVHAVDRSATGSPSPAVCWLVLVPWFKGEHAPTSKALVVATYTIES